MQSLKKLLGNQTTLGQLREQLKAQESLTGEVRSLLPSPLNEQLRGAVLKGRRLTLLVNSPAWASRLRYLAPQLMRQLRQKGLLIEQIVPRILPEQGKARVGRPARIPLLSRQSADTLRQTAESLEPGPLREALRRLSRHTGHE